MAAELRSSSGAGQVRTFSVRKPLACFAAVVAADSSQVDAPASEIGNRHPCVPRRRSGDAYVDVLGVLPKSTRLPRSRGFQLRYPEDNTAEAPLWKITNNGSDPGEAPRKRFLGPRSR